jgi:hypothetical protein
VGFPIIDAVHAGALLAFHQHLDRTVGQLQHLQDGGDAADLEHVRNGRLVLGCGLLRHEHDPALGFHRGFQRLDALGSPDKKGDHHVREDHHVAQRQQRQVNRGGR